MSQPESITDAFLPLVPDIPEADIPMFIAILERVAASNYRGWADSSSDPVEQVGLIACEAREIEIAEFIESLYPDAAATIASLMAKFPDLEARYDAVLAGRSRIEQFRIQSEAELGGADFMGQFAAANTGAVAARFTSLSACEEANSKFLAALVGAAG
ncbi:MAG: hypothetical protein AAF512_06240 [Pseudomonadota bacterium]